MASFAPVTGCPSAALPPSRDSLPVYGCLTDGVCPVIAGVGRPKIGTIRLVVGVGWTKIGTIRLVVGVGCTKIGTICLVVGVGCTKIGTIRLVVGVGCSNGTIRLVVGVGCTKRVGVCGHRTMVNNGRPVTDSDGCLIGPDILANGAAVNNGRSLPVGALTGFTRAANGCLVAAVGGGRLVTTCVLANGVTTRLTGLDILANGAAVNAGCSSVVDTGPCFTRAANGCLAEDVGGDHLVTTCVLVNDSEAAIS